MTNVLYPKIIAGEEKKHLENSKKIEFLRGINLV